MADLISIDTVDASPFKRLIMTIGELPTSFLDSMTYYEMLAWLCNYIEKTVIPAVNNNAAVLQELQDKFVELKSYVDNYFENLDVQDEIDHKLDEMASDGTLADIIAAYVQLRAILAYNNITEMKAAENLVDGSIVETYGFYSKGDGGGAKYLVREVTNQDVIDEIRLFALHDVDLVAELVIDIPMNVKQFGAKGDSTHDDTANIQCAIDHSSTVIVPAGTYMVDAETSINLKTGNKLILDNDAKIKAITNSADRYVVLKINNVNDVEISGGSVEGDKATHTGATGEWGYGIQVLGTSDNIYIHDINISNTWGDGIGITTTGDVKTERLVIKNARRNGMSVISANNFVSTDDYIEATSGTAPQFGVDIEPDDGTQILNNIVFNNLHTKGNTAGGGLSLHLAFTNATPYHIEVNNFKSEGDLRGIWVNTLAVATGVIKFNKPYILNATGNGLYIKNEGVGVKTVFDKLYIDGYSTAVTTGVSSGVIITDDANKTGGNIILNEPTVIRDQSTVSNKVPIRLDTTTNVTYKDIYIINPLDLDGGTLSYNSKADNVKFIDEFGTMVSDVDEAIVIGGNIMPSLVKTTNYTATRQIRISSAVQFPIGHKIRFVNTGTHGLTVYFQAQYIYGITTASNKVVSSTSAGAYLEIMRLSGTEWTVVSSSGTFTTN